jgi:broad specificity phosphatase PhoE
MVAVVAHNFVLRLLLIRLVGLDLSAWRTFSIDVASLSVVEFVRGRTVITLLNDTCHSVNLVP